MIRAKKFIAILFFLLFFSVPNAAYCYPDAEILGTSSINPPFDFSVTSTLSGFFLTSDRRLVVSYSDNVKLIDMGSYALEATQPPALNSDDGTDGIISALAYEDYNHTMLASQEDGDILIYDLDNVSAKPTSIVVADGDKLGPITFDLQSTSYAYVADNTTPSIKRVNLISAATIDNIPVSLPNISSFTFTDVIYVAKTNEIYFSTSAGYLVYLAAGSTTYSTIEIDSLGKKNIIALDDFSNGDYIYAVDATTPAVVRISTSSHSVITSSIDISANPSPKDIVITNVTNPNATYAYVAGSATPAGGMSVINTANDEVFDLGTDPNKDYEPIPVSATPVKVAASSSTDGYVYMGYSSGKVGILSANPFVLSATVTYSSGGSNLKPGESVTITFRSNETGTYTLKAGGSVDATGTTLTDNTGKTEGTVVANTDTAVTINYNDNSSVFTEGANDVWIFVTVSPNRGRRAVTVTIDTPPPNVTMRSVGFGNTRLYVNFDRINVSDMSSYRIYVDTDPAAVLTKTAIAATVAQASSGSTQTGQVSGLSNDVTYYVAIEAADSNGNISPARTNTFADGSVATGMPENTVGPAGMLGEKGCSLVKGGQDQPRQYLGILILLVGMIPIFLRRVMSPLLCKEGMGEVDQVSTPSNSPLQRGKTIIPSPYPSINSGHSKRGGGCVLLIILFIFIIFVPVRSMAQESQITENDIISYDVGKVSPQLWQLEVKTGFWLPSNSVLKSYFTNCCNLITRIEGGLLYHKKYGAELGVGFLYKSSYARGVTTGDQSQDRFKFILIPVETNFVWRADYFEWRWIVPFLRPGIDYVYYREMDKGKKAIQGVKYGMHIAGGIAINIGEIGQISKSMDDDMGINDFFLTLEGRYQWINNFGGKGLDLSGGVYSAGLLFEF